LYIKLLLTCTKVLFAKPWEEEDDLLAAFTFFDRDGSGKLSRLEIEQVMDVVGHSLTEDEMDRLFESTGCQDPEGLDFNVFVRIVAAAIQQGSTRDIVTWCKRTST